MCTLPIKLDILGEHLFHSDKIVVMALEFGKSVRGQRTVIYKNFEYVKDRENVCGTVAWRCKYKNKFQCKARIVTDESRIVAEKQPEHTQWKHCNLKGKKGGGRDEGYDGCTNGNT